MFWWKFDGDAQRKRGDLLGTTPNHNQSYGAPIGADGPTAFLVVSTNARRSGRLGMICDRYRTKQATKNQTNHADRQ
jgi:hypothetical protein